MKKEIKIFIVHNDCYETYPCEHYVTLKYNNKLKTKMMSWLDIVELANKTNFDLSNVHNFDYTQDE